MSCQKMYIKRATPPDGAPQKWFLIKIFKTAENAKQNFGH